MSWRPATPKRVIPSAVPFAFALADDATLTATPAWHDAPPGRHVRPETAVDGAASADHVADVVDGASRREWWIETSVYAVPLLYGWTAIINGDISPAFDFDDVRPVQDDITRRVEFF